MIEIILSSLIVATVGALAYVAWNDPKLYEKFFLILTIMVAFGFLTAIIWGVAVEQALNAVPDLSEVIKNKTQKEVSSPSNIILIVSFGLFIYNMILFFISMSRDKHMNK